MFSKLIYVYLEQLLFTMVITLFTFREMVDDAKKGSKCVCKYSYTLLAFVKIDLFIYSTGVVNNSVRLLISSSNEELWLICLK